MNSNLGVKQRHGFTLVELLIAVAVSIVLVSSATLVLSVGMRTFASTAGSGEAELCEVQLVSTLVQDITSALPLNGGAFVGDSTSMAFPRLLSPTRQLGDVGIAHISWVHHARHGWVRVLTFLDGSVMQETFGRMHDVRLTFAGDVDESPSSGSTAVEWYDQWTQRRFPGVVRIEARGFSLQVALACSSYTLAEEEAEE